MDIKLYLFREYVICTKRQLGYRLVIYNLYTESYV